MTSSHNDLYNMYYFLYSMNNFTAHVFTHIFPYLVHRLERFAGIYN